MQQHARRTLIAALAAGALVAAPASAGAAVLNSANAEEAFSNALIYSSWEVAWEGTSTVDAPTCPQSVITDGAYGGDAYCQVEFEYGGLWYYASGTVSPQQNYNEQFTSDGPTGTIRSQHTWVRSWRRSTGRCIAAHGKAPRLPGSLSSNDGSCYRVLLDENFKQAGKYTFHFKRRIYGLWAQSKYFPQWSTYNCTRGHPRRTYQCTNAFGDGFRWQP
jgi:hypothetical protein